MEIYNATGEPVEMSRVTLLTFANGESAPTVTVALSGLLANGGVFLVAHGSAVTSIKDPADFISSAGVNFNGDDAFGLAPNGTIVDVIGQIGYRPPSGEWGTGDCSTKDNTITRNTSVCCCDPDGSNVFDPSLEWIGHPQDDISDLGSHVTECEPVVAEESTWGGVKSLFR